MEDPMNEQLDDSQRAISHALECTVEIRTGSSVGAGCIIHPDGLVVTGRHVVSDPQGVSLRKVDVVLHPASDKEATIRATIFYSHRALDLALLWLEKDGPYPAMPMGDTTQVKYAQTVYALGSPGGLANTLSKGIVSNPHGVFRNIDCIQTDTAIDHGNSGGPLINTRGELIGINLWGLGQFDAAKFAVPIDYIEDAIGRAITSGRVKCLESFYCPLCGFNEPVSNDVFCRNCGAPITHQESLKVNEPPEKVVDVLEAFNKSAVGIDAVWIREVTYKGQPGFVSIARTTSNSFMLTASVPVMVMPVNGRTLSVDELAKLTASLGDFPDSRFVLVDSSLNMLVCRGVGEVDDTTAMPSINESLKTFADISNQVHEAFEQLYGGPIVERLPRKPPMPEPHLPNIKLNPKEMKVVRDVMASSDAHAQEMQRYLMEKWVKAGFIVGATSQMVVLDVPYGNQTTRLGFILSPNPEQNPRFGLSWESLRKMSGFPKSAVDAYQKSVKAIHELRPTQSGAYIELDDKFTSEEARGLIKAMSKLAASVVPEEIEASPIVKPVSPDNTKTTLETCGEHAREVFNLLIGGWNAAGGTVQCSKPGRIYLRLKTKAHRSGGNARLERNFNLAVLSAHAGKTPDNIQVTFGLADPRSLSAYLDCIPEEVTEFEKVVRSLPGFEQHGTITRLLLGDTFATRHAKELMKQMLALKFAEEKAP
jgi:hypothetical protein